MGVAQASPFDPGAGTVFLRSMNMVTSRRLPARPLAVPNLLTYARIIAVPAVVACLTQTKAKARAELATLPGVSPQWIEERLSALPG